jgi:hypothetical protein
MITGQLDFHRRLAGWSPGTRGRVGATRPKAGDAMTKSGRKRVRSGPRNAWDATIDAVDEAAPPTQAGEVDAGDEAGGGGDKGLDMETGDGGYGGDAVEEGRDAALAEPDRPADVEVHGDPRTRDGEAYPDATGDATR